MHAKIHFINFTRKFTFISVFFLIPLHFLKLGFSGWQIGFIIAVYAVAPLVVSFPTGWVNDRLSMAGLYYKDETAIDQNRKFGAYNVWMGLGPALGVIAGGALTKAIDFETVLVVYGAATIFVFLAVGSFDHQKFHTVLLRDYRRDILRGKTLLFVVFLFVLALHWSVEGTVYSPFLERNLGLGPFQTSAYIGGGLLFLALAAGLMSRLRFDARLNKRLLLAAMFVSGAGFILMTIRQPAISFLFRVLHDFSDGVMGVAIAVFVSRLFERRTIGGSAGMLLAIQILGQMTGSLVFAPLGYRFGLHVPFLVVGSLLALNAVFGVFIFRKIEY
jgi:Major Facilitator Superfamily